MLNMLRKGILSPVAKMNCFAFSALLFSALSLPACWAADDVYLSSEAAAYKWSLSTSAFADQQSIPKLHTADGKDISPPLAWTTAPAKTKSFAIVVDDPDAPAGTWVHWVIWDIPVRDLGLNADVKRAATLKDGSRQGKNSFGKIGWNGPSPPPGKLHHYIFKLYALDSYLDLKAGATKEELLQAMEKHVLAQAKLTGTYRR